MGLPSGLFPYESPVHTCPLRHPRYMPRSSHSSRFYHPHNSGRAEFNEFWIFLAVFRKTIMHQTLWKFVHWEPSFSMRTDGQI
jgi:hypothetical protein